ncbi:MAG: polysaccharide export protein [Opitutus sp.]|nr:polysaccharide export protein [Opitutus sp.]
MKTIRSSARWFIICAIAAGTSALVPVFAQPKPEPKPERKYVAYKITRGDRLSIGVVGEPELNVGGKRIEALGTINLLYIQEIRLVGLTINEAQEAIAKAYRDGRFLRNPQVSVTVDEYSSRTVLISGKVNSPGRPEIPADHEITIKEMIFKVGGFSETAKGTAVRVTRTLPDGTLKIFTLDVESAIKGKGKPANNDAAFVLEPDDIIYVPEKII